MTRLIYISLALRDLDNNLTTTLCAMHKVVLCCISQALRGLDNNPLPLLSHKSMMVLISTVDLLARFNTFD